MHSTLRPLLLVAVLATIVAACSASGGAASPTPPASPPAAPSVAPSESPAGGDLGAPSPDVPPPGIGESLLVQPQPGQQNVLSIPLERLEATAAGQTVTLTAFWTSGVEPCSVLDQVLVNVSAQTIDVTVREGTSDPDAMCVMMAQSKHTVVTFEAEPGSYTIRDTEGGAASIELTVE